MLRGIFALFFRSLRADSRSISVHISWCVLLLVIYAAMGFAQFESLRMGAPGLHFFRSVIYTNAVFITLLGIGYFSSAISEEKEEDTLGLMMMAGISPLGILLGKSTTRLFQVFILLAVQFPFTQLAVTLGGLMHDQIYAAYAALLAYSILLANVGLFFSVLCRRNRDASALTTLWIFGYIVAPAFAYGGYIYFTVGEGSVGPHWITLKPFLEPILYCAYQSSVFGQLSWVTQTGYQFSWTPQLITNALGGLALFFLSWWMFGHVAHDAATETTIRYVAPRKTGKLRWLDAGRVWMCPLVWKDFHFIAGGWFGALSRIGLYIGLYWLAFASMYPWHYPSDLRRINWRDATEGYQYFVVPLFFVDCALCLSRMFQEEIRHQTLASLLMLPRSIPYVVYQKVGGCLLGLLPGLFALFAAFVLLSESTKTLSAVVDKPFAWILLADLVLMVHMSALLSSYLRWGAFAISLVFFVCSISVAQLIEFTVRFWPNYAHLVGFLVIPLVFACVGCHLVLLLRLPALGER